MRPLDGVDVLLADLDGVVYAGDGAIPHAIESLNAAVTKGIKLGYLTNNASRTPQVVAEQLRSLGLSGTTAADVVSSPQAAVLLLSEKLPAPALVLVVGGAGLINEIERAGYRVTTSAIDKPDAVVQGFAPEVSWINLAEASYALAGEHNIPWVATNMDWTIPRAGGIAPGNGTLVSAVHTAVGRMPLVAGKPESALFELARVRFSAVNPLVVGDRLDTDILGARRSGMSSVFVLTGVDGAKALLSADESSRPDFIVEDLRGLSLAYPVIEDTLDIAGIRRVRVGNAIIRQESNRIILETSGSDVDRLRAAAAAVWGAGVPIYALDVDGRLYS